MSYKYLIVQMLCVYYADGVVVAEAREQWKNSRRRYNMAAARQLVRVLPADLALTFDLVIIHSCSQQ